MADIRNDIIELQEKVFGERRGISVDSPSHFSGEEDFVEWASGQGDLKTWPFLQPLQDIIHPHSTHLLRKIPSALNVWRKQTFKISLKLRLAQYCCLSFVWVWMSSVRAGHHVRKIQHEPFCLSHWALPLSLTTSNDEFYRLHLFLFLCRTWKLCFATHGLPAGESITKKEKITTQDLNSLTFLHLLCPTLRFDLCSCSMRQTQKIFHEIHEHYLIIILQLPNWTLFLLEQQCKVKMLASVALTMWNDAGMKYRRWLFIFISK